MILRFAVCLLSFAVAPTRAGTYQESITHTSSISGEFVEFSSKSTEKEITVRSSSVGTAGHPIDISAFRGDGQDRWFSKRPTIDSALVYSSLFADKTFSMIFANGTMQEAKITVSPDKLRRIEMIVKEAEKPFAVGNGSITYFWGLSKLPLDPHDASDCVEFLLSNEDRIVSFCDVRDADRCAAPIAAFPHLAPFLFRTPKEKQLVDFAWLCPPGKVCCAWECCDAYGGLSSAFAVIIVGSVIVCIMLVLLGMFGRYKYEGWKLGREEARYRQSIPQPRATSEFLESYSNPNSNFVMPAATIAVSMSDCSRVDDQGH